MKRQEKGLMIGGAAGVLAAFLVLIPFGKGAAGLCVVLGLLLGGFIGSRLDKRQKKEEPKLPEPKDPKE